VTGDLYGHVGEQASADAMKAQAAAVSA